MSELCQSTHTVRDESFFDFPDEGIATVDVESSEPALDIKNFRNLLSYESDSALDDYDEERLGGYFTEGNLIFNSRTAIAGAIIGLLLVFFTIQRI